MLIAECLLFIYKYEYWQIYNIKSASIGIAFLFEMRKLSPIKKGIGNSKEGKIALNSRLTQGLYQFPCIIAILERYFSY